MKGISYFVSRISGPLARRIRAFHIPAHGIRNAQYDVVQRSLASGIAVVLSTLREIFDENAYARFLDRHRLDRSRASYAAFLRENDRQRERRPRCC